MDAPLSKAEARQVATAVADALDSGDEGGQRQILTLLAQAGILSTPDFEPVGPPSGDAYDVTSGDV